MQTSEQQSQVILIARPAIHADRGPNARCSTVSKWRVVHITLTGRDQQRCQDKFLWAASVGIEIKHLAVLMSISTWCIVLDGV